MNIKEKLEIANKFEREIRHLWELLVMIEVGNEKKNGFYTLKVAVTGPDIRKESSLGESEAIRELTAVMIPVIKARIAQKEAEFKLLFA